MDLSRIEAWTRGMLEAEARRRGIRSPEFRTRGDLVRLILRHQYGDRLNAGRDRIAQSRRVFAQARELIGVAVGAAISALPEPLDTLMRLRGQVPLPKAPPVPRETVRRPQPIAEQPTAVSAPPQPAHRDVPVPVPRTRTFVEEPIRTRSMARLLVAQGHRERGLAIYEELLGRNSTDEALRDELAAVRRGEPVAAPLLPEPSAGLERMTLPNAGDRLSCLGDAGTGFALQWSITEAGLDRARAVLGREGELAARVVCIRPDPEDVVRSEITEHGPLPAAGAWQTPALPGAARCFAAVGLRWDERFVAIVHTQPETVPAEGTAPAQETAAILS